MRSASLLDDTRVTEFGDEHVDLILFLVPLNCVKVLMSVLLSFEFL